MKLTCNDTLYTYDAYHLLKAFYPDEEIEQQVDEEQESQIRIESDCDSCFASRWPARKQSFCRWTEERKTSGSPFAL